MPICIFTDAWLPMWGGGQVHIWETAKELITHHDCEIDIFAPNLIDKTQKEFPKFEAHLGGRLRLHRLGPKFIFPNFIGRILFTLSCFAKAITQEYDVYHSQTLTMVPLLPIIKIFHPRAKTAFTLHGSGKDLLGIGSLNKILPLKIVANLFLYKTPIDVRFTAAKSSIRAENHNDFIFLGNAVQKAFRQNFQRIKHGHKILFIGRFDPVKGVSLRISAVGELSKLDPSLKLTLVGHGPLENDIRSYISKHELDEVVEIKHLIGPEVIPEYQKADLFVLPSLSEGFPLVVLEAMALKLPVVATKVGDLQDIIDDGKTGFLFSPGNVDQLIDAISRGLNCDWKKVGLQARSKALEKYSWPKIADKIYDQYR